MKKKVIILSAAFAFAFIAAFNVNLNSQKNKQTSISFENTEALADNEENYGWDWWTQGATKDESPRIVQCSVSYGVPPYVVTNYGTRRVCDDGGSENCSVGSCEI